MQQPQVAAFDSVSNISNSELMCKSYMWTRCLRMIVIVPWLHHSGIQHHFTLTLFPSRSRMSNPRLSTTTVPCTRVATEILIFDANLHAQECDDCPILTGSAVLRPRQNDTSNGPNSHWRRRLSLRFSYQVTGPTVLGLSSFPISNKVFLRPHGNMWLTNSHSDIMLRYITHADYGA